MSKDELLRLVEGLSELLACSVIGGVHFAVEPELSGVDMSFAKRSQAHAASAILCAIHPIDEDGCFVHRRPINDERIAELIELANAYGEARTTQSEDTP